MDAKTLLADAVSTKAYVPRRSMKKTIAEKLATLIASFAR